MTQDEAELIHKNPRARCDRSLGELAALLVDSQVAAAQAVRTAIPDICMAAEAMAATLRDQGVLYYLAAGSSGLMASADAMELGGTFGTPTSQVRILMAGGLPRSAEMPGATEDDVSTLDRDLNALDTRDTVIAVSASGDTAYTLTGARIAREIGASVIGLSNTRDAPLLMCSDYPILIETGAEVLAGSTRLGAGTAQKIALNMLSTLMAQSLGHIHDGLMVNLRADNAKLHLRARTIVREITGVSDDIAADALCVSDGNVKLATLLSAGALSCAEAVELLDESRGHLGPALDRLEAAGAGNETKKPGEPQ